MTPDATAGQAGTHSDKTVSAELRGETMAYAAQSAVYNLAANFFEPYVGYRIQKRFSGSKLSHPEKHGNYTQNLVGEFAGDITGASTLLLSEALFPKQLHSLTRKIRSCVDPMYASLAHIALSDQKSAPDYTQQIDQWKTFQERNLARSVVIAAGAIAGNVATQKLLIKNPSPTRVIFGGKLLSSALTTALGLAVRFVFPNQTRNMDQWIGRNVFAPALEDKVIGDDNTRPASHAEKVASQAAAKQPNPTL